MDCWFRLEMNETRYIPRKFCLEDAANRTLPVPPHEVERLDQSDERA